MLQLNNKCLCESCFSPVDVSGSCPKCRNIPQSRPANALELNAILHGRYVIGKVLGQGGFSITYLAYDNKMDRIVAIKEFFPEMLVSRNRGDASVRINSPDNAESFRSNVQRFYDEAKMISELNHPNIIKVYNLYYENGTAFYTMEYLDGCDLRHYVNGRGGRIAENELIPIIACVAEALGTVHANGLLHRDIAPDNIFIMSNGTVKLIDFGASRSSLANGAEGFSVVLKQGFAPVEQYQRHGNQGPWTDIYALGATMYYCLNGTMPPVAPERTNNPHLSLNCSEPLAQVINKMMLVDAQYRYRTIAEFKRDLLGTTQQRTAYQNPNRSQNYNQSFNPNYGQGYNSNYGQGYDQGYNQYCNQNDTQVTPKQKNNNSALDINSLFEKLGISEKQKLPIVAVAAIIGLAVMLGIFILLFG